MRAWRKWHSRRSIAGTKAFVDRTPGPRSRGDSRPQHERQLSAAHSTLLYVRWIATDGHLRPHKRSGNCDADDRFQTTAATERPPLERDHSPMPSLTVFVAPIVIRRRRYVSSSTDRDGAADPLLSLERLDWLAEQTAFSATRPCGLTWPRSRPKESSAIPIERGCTELVRRRVEPRKSRGRTFKSRVGAIPQAKEADVREKTLRAHALPSSSHAAHGHAPPSKAMT